MHQKFLLAPCLAQKQCPCMIEEGALLHQSGDTFTTKGNQSSNTENISLSSLLLELSADFKNAVTKKFSQTRCAKL